MRIAVWPVRWHNRLSNSENRHKLVRQNSEMQTDIFDKNVAIRGYYSRRYRELRTMGNPGGETGEVSSTIIMQMKNQEACNKVLAIKVEMKAQET